MAVTVDPNRAAGTFTYYSGGYDEGEVHDEVVALLRRGALDAVADRGLVKALVRLGD
jgi:hypothetical protein